MESRASRWVGRAATAGCLVVLLAPAVSCTSKGPKPAPTGPVGLTVTPSKPEYRPGEAITLQLKRINTRGSACMLSRVPDGVVSVLSLTRDGAAVTPSFGAATRYRDFSAYLIENLVSVPPQGSLDLALPSDPGALAGAALPTTAANGRGGATITWWPVKDPGTYQVTVGYLRPPLRGVPADPCSAAMEQATATFRVKAG